LEFLPGIAIALTKLSFNLLGNGLRDTLDPWLSNEATNSQLGQLKTFTEQSPADAKQKRIHKISLL
jgi:hypothetical protein